MNDEISDTRKAIQSEIDQLNLKLIRLADQLFEEKLVTEALKQEVRELTETIARRERLRLEN